MKFLRSFLLAGVMALAAAVCVGALAADNAPWPASVQIRNAAFDRLLRPKDANRADGAPLVLYPEQPWKCMTWTVHTGSDGLVSLQNIFTSKSFAAEKDGSVKQIPFKADQLWKIEKLAGGDCRILDPATGKVLTARDESTLILEDWKDAAGQKWKVVAAPAHLTM